MKRSSLVLAIFLAAMPVIAQTPHERLQDRLNEERARVDAIRTRLERHVDAAVQFLRDIGPCGETPATPSTTSLALHEELEKLPDELDRAHDDLEAARREAVAALKPDTPANMRRSLQRAIEAADDTLSRRRDASIAARWLRRVAEERRRSESHQELCRILDHVGLPEPFTLSEARRDPLLPLRRLHESATAHVNRRVGALQRGEWSLGLGVQWTPEIDHAGEPVALVAFRPLPEDMPLLRDASIRPWVQLGTGLQFDEPSFYVGGAVDLGPYLHLGVGWTAHRDEDEEGYDGNVYVAMTVRLERLREWMR